MKTFLLAHTPTSLHRLTVKDDQIILTQETSFAFNTTDIPELVFFLGAVKGDKKNRHTFTAMNYTFEYAPVNPELEKVSIARRTTGRSIVMALSTAYKLLDGLTGKAGRLVEE